MPSNEQEADQSTASQTMIVTRHGEIPYSVGYLAESLLVLGLSLEEAYNYAHRISDFLLAKKIQRIATDELINLVIQEFSQSNHSYALRAQFLRDDLRALKPLVVILGGVTGIGKSTVSLLISKRFHMDSIMGGDFVREVFRSAINPKLMPTIHCSSYQVGEILGLSISRRLQRHIIGFEEQARKVMVGIEAMIAQVLGERQSILIEGVHGIPYLLKGEYQNSSDVVPILLTLEDEELHYNRLAKREVTYPKRPRGHLKFFERIRSIQEYLAERCRELGFPVIDLSNEEKAMYLITEAIWERKLREIHDED